MSLMSPARWPRRTRRAKARASTTPRKPARSCRTCCATAIASASSATAAWTTRPAAACPAAAATAPTATSPAWPRINNVSVPGDIAAAKAAVNAVTDRVVWTNTGQGLIDAKDMLLANPGNTNPDHIILLSDGQENANPLYNTPAVKGALAERRRVRRHDWPGAGSARRTAGADRRRELRHLHAGADLRPGHESGPDGRRGWRTKRPSATS